MGGPSSRIADLFEHAPGFCEVLQSDWTPLDPPTREPGFSIRYRVFSRTSARVATLLDDAETLRAWSERINHDLARPGEAQRLLLKVALETRPKDLILVSSTNPAHIVANVETAEDDRLIAPALALAKVIDDAATGVPA